MPPVVIEQSKAETKGAGARRASAMIRLISGLGVGVEFFSGWGVVREAGDVVIGESGDPRSTRNKGPRVEGLEEGGLVVVARRSVEVSVCAGVIREPYGFRGQIAGNPV